MKLPFHLGVKKKEVSRMFLSLLFFPDAVEAAVWELDHRTGAHIVSAVTQELLSDSWNDRLDAADKCITTLEELAKTNNLEKVVLGLPPSYLTREGDIVKEIRQPLKHITESLGLTPIGYVSIYQAIIHKLKSEEGVPPSVILLGLSSAVITLHLYRVGTLVGEETVALQSGLAEHLEDALIRLNNGGVLPSRILLYGTKRSDLESVKRDVLKHPWTRGNQFLHFPKVEILPGDGAAVAVSYAGSAELAHELTDMDESANSDIDVSGGTYHSSSMATVIEDSNQTVQKDSSSTATHKKIKEIPANEIMDSEETEDETLGDVLDEEEMEDEEENGEEDPEVGKDVPIAAGVTPHLTPAPIEEEEIETEEDELMEDKKSSVDPIHANVVAVDPKMVGFTDTEESDDEEYAIEDEERAKHKKIKAPNVSGVLSALGGFASRLKPKTDNRVQGYRSEEETSKQSPTLLRFVPLIVLIIGILFVLYYLFTNILPKATVEVTLLPKLISKGATIIIDPELSQVSLDSQRIPGIKKEEKQTGEKTVPASGKKVIGDPSHGTITLFNKSQTTKTLKRGSAVNAGSLTFLLDDDVAIASASESVDTLTYGKANVKVTAKAIGTDSNIAEGKTFTIPGISSDLLSGRNDAAFSGGSSTNITVVSRADQDAIVNALKDDLIDKVKQAFGTGENEETLIPETIKTQITERVFSQEVGAQSKDVNGKITVSISGIAYKKDHVSQLLSQSIKAQVPDGYEFDPAKLTITVANPKIAKDGTIRIDASGSSQIYPNLPISLLLTDIAGKTKDEAQTIIKRISGVADVVVSILSSPLSSKLPIRAGNIRIITKETQ